jgi:hypothetical protein
MVPHIKMRGGFAAGTTQFAHGAVMDRPSDARTRTGRYGCMGGSTALSPNLMGATNTLCPCACQVKRSVKRFHINEFGREEYLKYGRLAVH